MILVLQCGTSVVPQCGTRTMTHTPSEASDLHSVLTDDSNHRGSAKSLLNQMFTISVLRTVLTTHIHSTKDSPHYSVLTDELNHREYAKWQY